MIEGSVPYDIMEHTADLGVIVTGCSLADLFERCAAAMFDQLVDLSTVRTDMVELVVEVEAQNIEELLVAFLGELLGEAMVRGVVFGAFEVEMLEGARIKARAWGEPLERERHGFKTELKAVTYHALSVDPTSQGWRAQVLFDI